VGERPDPKTGQSAATQAQATRSGAGQSGRIRLRAGPLEAEFEPQSGFLRWVRVGGREVVRGVYAAVRDRNWNTVEPVVRDLVAEIAAHRFTLGFTADCRAPGIDFSWHGRLEGDPEGRITYRFSGSAAEAFESNRIGFCLLHPIARVAGRPCQVEHVDGAVEEGEFPARISPLQPFQDIRAVSYEPESGLRVTVRLTGDTFEMEDQRNWTDASFKTYCRPLGLPFPFTVPVGSTIEQAVEIRAERAGPITAVAAEPEGVAIDLLPAAGPFPAVGVGLGPDPVLPGGDLPAAVARLSPRYLRVDLNLSRPEWARTLRGADELATAAAAGLELAVHLDTAANANLAALAAAVASLASPIARVLVFQPGATCTPPGFAEAVRNALAHAAASPPIAVGTDAFFAELNRGRPDPAAADLVAFSINPQVHAFDEASIVETIEAQEEAVRSARVLADGKGIVVSPVTLRMRWNPNATAPVPEAEALAAATDPRQGSLFTAAWTVGSLRALAAGPVAAATYYELVGPRGILDRGGVFPVYHVLADACGPAAPRFVPTRSSAPLAAEAVGLLADGRLRLVVANLQPHGRRIVCRGLPPGRPVALRVLDAGTAALAATEPDRFRHHTTSVTTSSGGELQLDLHPYAVATLDEEVS
jgi:hypothetical protein